MTIWFKYIHAKNHQECLSHVWWYFKVVVLLQLALFFVNKIPDVKQLLIKIHVIYTLQWWNLAHKNYFPSTRLWMWLIFQDAMLFFKINFLIQVWIVLFQVSKFFLATPRSSWAFSSLTRDWTCVPCIGSVESKSLDCQGSPSRSVNPIQENQYRSDIL